jgi:hypothetical protein
MATVRLWWLQQLLAVAEARATVRHGAHPLTAILETLCVFPGCEGLPRSLGSVLGAAVARFLPHYLLRMHVRMAVPPLMRPPKLLMCALSTDVAVLYVLEQTDTQNRCMLRAFDAASGVMLHAAKLNTRLLGALTSIRVAPCGSVDVVHSNYIHVFSSTLDYITSFAPNSFRRLAGWGAVLCAMDVGFSRDSIMVLCNAIGRDDTWCFVCDTAGTLHRCLEWAQQHRTAHMRPVRLCVLEEEHEQWRIATAGQCFNGSDACVLVFALDGALVRNIQLHVQVACVANLLHRASSSELAIVVRTVDLQELQLGVVPVHTHGAWKRVHGLSFVMTAAVCGLELRVLQVDATREHLTMHRVL